LLYFYFYRICTDIPAFTLTEDRIALTEDRIALTEDRIALTEDRLALTDIPAFANLQKTTTR
jgi:hypothetical protein